MRKKTMLTILFLIIAILPIFAQSESKPQIFSDEIIVLLCFLGIIAQEVLYWYELRNEHDKDDLFRIRKDKKYWTITIIYILVFGVLSSIYFIYQEIGANMFTITTMAAAFARLFKAGVKAANPPKVATRNKTIQKLYFMI